VPMWVSWMWLEPNCELISVYDIEIMKRSVRPMRLLVNSLTVQGGEIEILRRYTDFVRLRNALKTRFPVSPLPRTWLGDCLTDQHLRGAIPSLPGKNHMGPSFRLVHLSAG
jgi:hypothetical protein